LRLSPESTGDQLVECGGLATGSVSSEKPMDGVF
jgi:hypothetical protein